MFCLAFLLTAPVSADVVLLDEYWFPEIVHMETEVAEVDVARTGDANDAASGDVSVVLRNTAMAPNVRFWCGTRVLLEEVPAEESDLVLQYRTDAFVGVLRVEIWMMHFQGTPAPVKVMEAVLDGGGEGGKLITDDGWHEARGVLLKCEDYDKIPQQAWDDTWVWIAAEDGWDIEHETHIDRVEIDVLSGPFSETESEPATRVRPNPGAQISGDGWIWWEAEDAVESTFRLPGIYHPQGPEWQKMLSNGTWLTEYGSTKVTAKWEIDVAEAGTHALWSRDFNSTSQYTWRWDEGEWQTFGPDPNREDSRQIHLYVRIGWAKLGDVELTAGKHVFEVRGPERQGNMCFDCFVLSRDPFEPDGAKKPGEE